MDADRQEAYRHLLYAACNELRWGRTDSIGWNIFSWKRAASRLCVNQAIADSFHNLAFFSIHNFEGFDEQVFWNTIEHLGQKHDPKWTERYRGIFDDYVAGRAARLS